MRQESTGVELPLVPLDLTLHPGMSDVTLPGIPESIMRDDYLRLIEGVGFKVDDLVSLEFKTEGIYAEVYASDAKGRYIVDGDEPATHRVFIRIEN